MSKILWRLEKPRLDLLFLLIDGQCWTVHRYWTSFKNTRVATTVHPDASCRRRNRKRIVAENHSTRSSALPSIAVSDLLRRYDQRPWLLVTGIILVKLDQLNSIMMPCKYGGYGFETFHLIKLRDRRKFGTQAYSVLKIREIGPAIIAAKQSLKKTQGPNVVDKT